MTGRRLLDAAAIFTAARKVASKHVAVRTHQLDVYSKTSTLARAIQSQSGRVTLTVKAAAALAERFNGPRPQYSTQTSQASQAVKSTRKPGQDGSAESNKPTQPKEGLAQDHFYERSNENTTPEPPPEGNLDVKPEKAKRAPLPDGSVPSLGGRTAAQNQDTDTFSEIPMTEATRGTSEEEKQQADETTKPTPFGKPNVSESTSSTNPQSVERAKVLQREAEGQIPSQAAKPPPSSALNPDSQADADTKGSKPKVMQEQETFYTPVSSSGQVLSALPRAKIPGNTGDVQESEEPVPDAQINQDVFYSPRPKEEQQAVPQAQAVPQQEQLSEEAYSEIFHSPRVAKMLKGQPRKDVMSKGLELSGAKNTPVKDTKAPKEHDQVSSGVRTPAHDKTATADEKKPSMDPVASTDQDKDDVYALAGDMAKDANRMSSGTSGAPEAVDNRNSRVPFEMRESRVPSSRFGRIWQYGGLAASMTIGAVGESFRRATGSGASAGGSLMLSAGNIERLVAKLSRMRGAALKLGQMMSFQDSKMLPGPINEVLQRVQDSADYMPPSQRDKVLTSNLGADWRDLFSSFDEKPMAAASIGQVHRAVLRSSGQPVAVKVQYPGVANSIDSDLSNLSILLNASRLLPKGLYLDKTIANARTELAWECDYIREAEMGARFRTLLASESSTFHVPTIIPEASGPQVLTADFCPGIGVTKVQNFTQEQKDWIGTNILRLCLREITEFKFMQTDPNWTNFLYNAETEKLELLDFGASRDFPEKFITLYIRTLLAASSSDRTTVRDLSIQLGYLTGHESQAMLNAHVNSVLTLAEPFMENAPEVYDFRDQTITERVRGFIPVMVRERLAPPPEETYSLHRKLSGAFLLCARLGSRVRCREMFQKAMEKAGVI